MTDNRIEEEADSVVRSAPGAQTVETGLLILQASQAISLKRIADALEKIEQHMAPRGMTYNDPHAPEDGQLPPGMDK